MILIYVKTLITWMISHNNDQQWLKVGNRYCQYSIFIFRTGLRATHVVLGGYLVPAGTVLVTPGLDSLSLNRFREMFIHLLLLFGVLLNQMMMMIISTDIATWLFLYHNLHFHWTTGQTTQVFSFSKVTIGPGEWGRDDIFSAVCL